jgi:hypothetical protein
MELFSNTFYMCCHKFHDDCLTEWFKVPPLYFFLSFHRLRSALQTHLDCPQCRVKLSEMRDSINSVESGGKSASCSHSAPAAARGGVMVRIPIPAPPCLLCCNSTFKTKRSELHSLIPCSVHSASRVKHRLHSVLEVQDLMVQAQLQVPAAPHRACIAPWQLEDGRKMRPQPLSTAGPKAQAAEWVVIVFLAFGGGSSSETTAFTESAGYYRAILL